jgi:hypothetical protein
MDALKIKKTTLDIMTEIMQLTAIVAIEFGLMIFAVLVA